MKVGFYAGSFDPFTNGHLQIVKKACDIFDVVVIGIGTNPLKKSRRFDKEKMRQAIYEVMQKEGLDEKVEVYLYDTSMTVDAAQYYRSNYLIRGIRNGMDYEYEENIAAINQEVGFIDTIYFRAGEYGNVSSSMVMELYTHGHDISKYVPEPVLKVIEEK